MEQGQVTLSHGNSGEPEPTQENRQGGDTLYVLNGFLMKEPLGLFKKQEGYF